MNNAILQVDDIQKYYGNRGSLTKAVDHISFQVCKGEILGIMGASGSGKTSPLCTVHSLRISAGRSWDSFFRTLTF